MATTGLSQIGIAVLALLVAMAPVAAHQDVILSIASDGTVEGLPERYKDTRLTIRFSAHGQLESLVFRASGGEATLAPCLMKVVKSRSLQDVRVSGSWYHESLRPPPKPGSDGGLPHYVNAGFSDPDQSGEEAKYRTTVRYLFSLETGSLIPFSWIQPTFSDLFGSLSNSVR